MKYHLSSSILAADFMELGKEIGATKRGGADRIHFDVMDGVFVPSISFGMTILESVRKGTDLFLDVHLMIVEPERYIEEFVKLGADSLTVHYEAAKDPIAVLKSIRSFGKKAGLAISPKTPPEAIMFVCTHTFMCTCVHACASVLQHWGEMYVEMGCSTLCFKKCDSELVVTSLWFSLRKSHQERK